MKSLSDDTQEDRIFRGDADGAANGLRARLEREASGGDAEDVLTPELALVDPDLARRARELLPEPARVPRWNGHERVAEAPRVAQGPRPRSKRRLAVWMLAVTLLGAAVGAALSSTNRVPRLVSDATPSSLGPIKDLTPPAPPSPAAETRRPASPQAGETAATATTGASSTASPEPAPSAKPPAPVPTAPAGRAFAWVRIPGAASYLVQFYRGRKEIFRARPSRPRIVLPGRWSFEGREYTLLPGRYRWTVRPRLRGRRGFGQPIVRAKLVI